MSCENPFGETIYSYSRTQAIEDGVLVDLSRADSIRQHWKYPFACISAAWAIIEEALEKPGRDVSGIRVLGCNSGGYRLKIKADLL
jgi:PHP family Zn ribbon phosphoesterase